MKSIISPCDRKRCSWISSLYSTIHASCKTPLIRATAMMDSPESTLSTKYRVAVVSGMLCVAATTSGCVCHERPSNPIQMSPSFARTTRSRSTPSAEACSSRISIFIPYSRVQPALGCRVSHGVGFWFMRRVATQSHSSATATLSAETVRTRRRGPDLTLLAPRPCSSLTGAIFHSTLLAPHSPLCDNWASLAQR
jgi:hypothetical protein